MTDRRRAVVTTPDLTHKSPTLDTPHPAVPERIADTVISLQGGAADDDKFVPFGFGLVETEGSIRYAQQILGDLWIVRVLCLGEREATIYGGEQAGECDGLVGICNDYTNAFGCPNFTSWWHSGSLSQVADANFAAQSGAWTETLVITDSTGKRRAICYAIERWANVASQWSTGIEKIRYRFRASRVKNTATDVVEYTVNPYWQARFWALDPAGALLKPSRINEASFQTAAANSPSGSYESHMLLSGTVQDCRKQFGLLGAGSLVFAGGNQLTAIADRRTDPVVASYDDTHLSTDKPIEIGPVADTDQMVNKVSIEYTDTTNPISGLWKLVTVSLSTAGLLAGSETEVATTYKLPQLHTLGVVQLMLGYLLYDYQQVRIKANWLANAGGPRLIGDVVTQAIPALGITDNFRIAVRDKQPNGTYDVELQLIDARKWAGASSAPAAKVGSTLQDPYMPPVPPPPTLTQEGVDVRVDFNVVAYQFYDFQRITVQPAGGVECLLGEATYGPLRIYRVTPGLAYTVRAYTFSSGSTIPSAAASAVIIPTYAPPEMIGDVTLIGSALVWSRAPVRSYAAYPSTGWTSFGMATFDPWKIQDSKLSETAATWGANPTSDFGTNGVYCGVRLDAGALINPSEFWLYHSALSNTNTSGVYNPLAAGLIVEFSDTDPITGPWTADGSSIGTSDADPSKRTLLVIRRASSGAHRYWRFSKGVNVFLSGTLTEIKIATFGADSPVNQIAGFKLTGFTPLKKTDNDIPPPFYTNDVFVFPTAATPIDGDSFTYRWSVINAYSGGFYGGSRGYVEIRTVSITGDVSCARPVWIAMSAFQGSGGAGTSVALQAAQAATSPQTGNIAVTGQGIFGDITLTALPVYHNNNDALAGGLVVGQVYQLFSDRTQIRLVVASPADGQVATISVTANGIGYTFAPIVVIGAPPSGGVQATAIASVDNGLVIAVIMTDPGRGYTFMPAVSFTGGGGYGAAAVALSDT